MKHLQATFPISRAAGDGEEAQEEGRREASTSHIPNIAAGATTARRHERRRRRETSTSHIPNIAAGATTARRHEEEGRRETSTSHIPNIAARTTTARRHERRGDVKHLQATFPISRRGRRRLGGTRGGGDMKHL